MDLFQKRLVFIPVNQKYILYPFLYRSSCHWYLLVVTHLPELLQGAKEQEGPALARYSSLSEESLPTDSVSSPTKTVLNEYVFLLDFRVLEPTISRRFSNTLFLEPSFLTLSSPRYEPLLMTSLSSPVFISLTPCLAVGTPK